MLLREQGFSPVKAELWAEFICQVLAIYWKAADQLITPSYWEKFKTKRGALGKAKRKKDQFVSVPLEDAITSEIGALADELRCNLEPEHFLRKHDVQFKYEALVYSDVRAGRHSKKIDLEVVSAYPDAPRLAIEAKPLKSTADIQKRYLASEGLGCFFTSDSPYSDGPVGAMLAYTICGDNRSMREHVLAALKEYKPAVLGIHRISINNLCDIDCSHHDRSACGLMPITILHLERIFPLDVHDA